MHAATGSVDDIPVAGGRDELPRMAARGLSHGFVSIGNNADRELVSALAEAAGVTLVTLVDPASVMAPTRIGACLGGAVGEYQCKPGVTNESGDVSSLTPRRRRDLRASDHVTAQRVRGSPGIRPSVPGLDGRAAAALASGGLVEEAIAVGEAFVALDAANAELFAEDVTLILAQVGRRKEALTRVEESFEHERWCGA